jgi:hypothetical protein
MSGFVFLKYGIADGRIRFLKEKNNLFEFGGFNA